MNLPELEFILGYDRDYWVCKYGDELLKSTRLEEMDVLIRRCVKKKHGRGKYRVNMLFDMNVFPRWLHQYMPHYFNREFIVELK